MIHNCPHHVNGVVKNIRKLVILENQILNVSKSHKKIQNKCKCIMVGDK